MWVGKQQKRGKMPFARTFDDNQTAAPERLKAHKSRRFMEVSDDLFPLAEVADAELYGGVAPVVILNY